MFWDFGSRQIRAKTKIKCPTARDGAEQSACRILLVTTPRRVHAEAVAAAATAAARDRGGEETRETRAGWLHGSDVFLQLMHLILAFSCSQIMSHHVKLCGRPDHGDIEHFEKQFEELKALVHDPKRPTWTLLEAGRVHSFVLSAKPRSWPSGG